MGKYRVADRTDLSVAPDQGIQELVVGLVNLVVEERNRDIVLVPAETRIIKVDHVQPFSVNDNVVRVKIGMNQTVGCGILSERQKERMYVPSQHNEVCLLGRGE